MTTTVPTSTPEQLERTARGIDRAGIRAVEPDVADVVARARRQGLRGVALEVLADTREPAVARERAFGRVAVRVVRDTGQLPVLAA